VIARAMREISLRLRDRLRWLSERTHAIRKFCIATRLRLNLRRAIENLFARMKKILLVADIIKETL
jgi:hypothetical protein